MRFNTLFFLLVISCLYVALAQVAYDDCCLKYVKTMTYSRQRHAMMYRRQMVDGGCNIPAVIFTMRRGRVLCANPNEKWVNELTKKIDEKLAKRLQRKENPQRLYRG
ncbi:C-C motif chemokine 25 [Pempheris klunzingeri]|uniref:C-C motif chemokine 25 n=1 Tax=Pempheris klunzingeri TaxID=3127111 RepID=UPI00397FD505